MAPRPVSRTTEGEAISDLLERCCAEPASLLLEGEAGIGKTTLWFAAVEQARMRGIQVLTARATATESVLSHLSVADLLSTVDAEVLAILPAPQRLAVDRILLRANDDVPVDQRAVAAAFLSTLKVLSDAAPVLVAIDDLQWLDPSSARVIAFAARRFSGRVGLLGTVRTGDEGDELSWLHLEPPDAMTRIVLRPLSVGAVHQILLARFGRSMSRQTVLRIHEASGGNPFYALELARAMTERESTSEMTLPTTLTGLVASKIGVLGADLREALLAAACLAAPTVDLVARAIGRSGDDCVQRLLVAEAQGIIAIDRNRLHFSHPLLTAGVYTDAAPVQRRAMHQRLAGLVDDAELRARHLALAATHGDEATLDALDVAARLASRRGAPAAAAEFMELATELGVNNGEHQIRCASYHFNAGNTERARAILDKIVNTAATAAVRAEALGLLGLWNLLDGSSRDAASLLEQAAAEIPEDRRLLVQILVALSFARLNVHAFDAAAEAAGEAVTIATRAAEPHLLSQALSMLVLVRFLVGEGLDDASLDAAVQLEDATEPPSAMLWPTAQRAELLIGIGRLDEGRRELQAVRQRYLERGAESELTVISFHSALAEIWRADFAAASLVGDDAMQRAGQLGGVLPMSVAQMIKAAVAAYTGDEKTARRDAADALAALRLCDSPATVTVWPMTTLGFLEVSLGNYQAALDVLQPLISVVEQAPAATEIFVAPFVPDAVEALIQLDRLGEAHRLIELLLGNGRRLDRPWMLALGARCHAMLLAANRDVGAAVDAAHRAMAQHERLPMPFERARTQLLLGELQRRQRSRENAAAVLRDAKSTFENLNTPLWADRARKSLDRIQFGRPDSKTLTSAEQRIADLAAAGITNNDIAGSLFISPKTVEVHLSRIYRKLGIRSRAELGRRLDRLTDGRGA